MEDDLQTKLNRVLSDPDSMAKIMEIASGLGISQSQPPPSPPPAEQTAFSQPSPVLPPLGKDQPMLALLSSLKPLLSKERQERIDQMTKLMTIASVIGPLLGRK